MWRWSVCFNSGTQVARKETQAFSLKDKVGSLKRIMSGRPLPSAPHGLCKPFYFTFYYQFLTEIHIRHKIASRSEFSGSPPPQSPGAQSINSDGQRRDRFSSLQERYRQHQIAMKELDRQNSTSGWTQSSSTQVGFRFLICWFIVNNPWSFVCFMLESHVNLLKQ